jgi:hypothetical protein
MNPAGGAGNPTRDLSQPKYPGQNQKTPVFKGLASRADANSVEAWNFRAVRLVAHCRVTAHGAGQADSRPLVSF